jgi:hypothetical protein
MIHMKKLPLLILAFCCLCGAQINYPMMPMPRQQFTNNGAPLSGGFLYTWAAGTSTPLATYHIDTLGSLTANTNPVILDVNGSAEVRLLPQAYKMQLTDSNNVQIWQIDQIQDFGQLALASSVLLNPAFANLQTIAGPLAFTTLSLNSGTPLTTTNQSGTGSLCLVTNCALVTPSLNGVNIANSPGTYQNFANSVSPGTILNDLANLVAPGNAGVKTAPAGTTGGIMGIVSAGAGTTGVATVQESGQSFCNFDGAATTGDYVQMSSSVAGDCTDAGANYPTSGQVIGRVEQTSGSPALLGLTLFGPEIQVPTTLGLAAITSCATGLGAGSSPALTCSSAKDGGGYISLTTGSSPSTNSQVWIISFGATHTGHNCSISPANAAAVSSGVFIGSNSVTPTFYIDSGASALTGATLYAWQYTCNFY